MCVRSQFSRSRSLRISILFFSSRNSMCVNCSVECSMPAVFAKVYIVKTNNASAIVMCVCVDKSASTDYVRQVTTNTQPSTRVSSPRIEQPTNIFVCCDKYARSALGKHTIDFCLKLIDSMGGSGGMAGCVLVRRAICVCIQCTLNKHVTIFDGPNFIFSFLLFGDNSNECASVSQPRNYTQLMSSVT